MGGDYRKRAFKQVFSVSGIVSLHYFEFHKNYSFAGERHDFWEIVYVDKGEFIAEADGKAILLKKGELIFHKPGEFHTVKATGEKACNLMILTFFCRSAAMHFFENKIFMITGEQRALLAKLLSEGRAVYEGPFDRTEQKELIRRKDAPVGGEQLVKLYLEQLLISFRREDGSISKGERLPYSVRDAAENAQITEILSYFDRHLGEEITMERLCRRFGVGETYLKSLFRKKVGDSPIHHLLLLRIAEAKRLIREEGYNFTQIAELCGFHSIHYFSRAFKAVTQMTPSEYALSVKAYAEK